MMSESSGGTGAAAGGDGGRSGGTGGGDGEGSAGTTPRCIHCEKELPEPACKICSSCGKPAQKTQVDKADDSYVAHCFKCETRLFHPSAKFCHDCGAEQPTPSQHPTDSGPPPPLPVQPPPSQPQAPQEQPASAAASKSHAPLPLRDTGPDQRSGGVATHYEGVQQAVQAHRAQQEGAQGQGGGDPQPRGGSGEPQTETLSPTQQYMHQGGPGRDQQSPPPPPPPLHGAQASRIGARFPRPFTPSPNNPHPPGSTPGAPQVLVPSSQTPHPQGSIPGGSRLFGVPYSQTPHGQQIGSGSHNAGTKRVQLPPNSQMVTGLSSTGVVPPTDTLPSKQPGSLNANLESPASNSGTSRSDPNTTGPSSVAPPSRSPPSATTSQAGKNGTSPGDKSSQTQKTPGQPSSFGSQPLVRQALHSSGSPTPATSGVSSTRPNGGEQSPAGTDEQPSSRPFSVSIETTPTPEQENMPVDEATRHKEPKGHKRSVDEDGKGGTELQPKKQSKAEDMSAGNPIKHPLSTPTDPLQTDKSSPEANDSDKDGPIKPSDKGHQKGTPTNGSRAESQKGSGKAADAAAKGQAPTRKRKWRDRNYRDYPAEVGHSLREKRARGSYQDNQPVITDSSDSDSDILVLSDSKDIGNESDGEPQAYRKPEHPEELLRGKASAGRDTRTKTSGAAPSSSPSASQIPKGLSAGKDKSITVTFHALLPKHLWEWDDKSKVYIRFGDWDLGNWHHNCGPLTESKELAEGLSEMTGEIPIAAHLLNYQHVIPYKYIVYSPKAAEDNDRFEYLHDFRALVNRALVLSPQQFTNSHGGVYHQYDTVVYPKNVKTKTLTQKAKDVFGTFTGLWSASSQEEVLLTLSQMCEVCFRVYLEPFRIMLSKCEFPQGFNIHNAGKQIEHIFSFFRFPKIVHPNSLVADVRPQRDLLQKLKEWLELIVADLIQLPSDHSGKHMVSALTIAYCFCTLGVSHPKLDKFAVPVLKLLEVTTDLEKRQCPEYPVVCSVLPNEKQFKAAVARGIANLIMYTQQRGFKSDEWIRAIPLYHFLMECVQPFDPPEMNPLKIIWSDMGKELSLNEVRKKAEPGCITQCLEKFQALTEADPLLLRGLVYICPRGEYSAVFNKIPPFLSATLLSYHTIGETINTHDAMDWSNWIGVIRTVSQEWPKDETEKPESLVSMVDASLLLCSRLRPKLLSSTFVELLKASFSLVLFAIAKFNTVCPNEEKYSKNEKVAGALGKLKGSLKGWITDRKVIGGSMFGGSVNTRWWSAEEEIKIWHSFLQMECPNDTAVVNDWQTAMRGLIQTRVNAVPIRAKTDLVCLLEGHGDVHPVLSDIFMAAGMEAIDEMLTKSSKEAAYEFEKLAATHSERVGRLLGTLLKKKYPQLDPQVPPSFDELLSWRLWPNFIKIHESGSKLYQGMPPECREFCLLAVSVLVNKCHQVSTGNITMNELYKITRAKEEIKRLCQAAFKGGDQAQTGQLSFKGIEAALRSRMDEFAKFEEYRGHLSHLCNHIQLAVQGLIPLKQEVQQRDYSKCAIRTLCRNNGGKVEILCFQSAASLTPFAAKFHVMVQVSASELFQVFWRETMDAVISSKPSITLDDIPQVWAGAFQECQKLLEAVRIRTIKLSKVDKQFKPYRQSNLDTLLLNLHQGVCQCTGVSPANKKKEAEFICSAVGRMRSYWDLCNYRDTANVFLKIKDALNLTKGDFRDVEKLSKELTSSMRDQTLGDVNDELIKTGRFLKDIASDPHRKECLEAFARCQNVVAWLKEVTKDVSDLQNFVNVALATAAGGEDDLAHDKLSNLRAVGSGFGSLIYKLPKNAGYREVSEGCRTLWDALKNNPKLETMLGDCSKELEWYKGVKETQGSVEVTSYGQMDNILAYGHYRVGVATRQTVRSIHDIIHLKLDDCQKQLPKTRYSLDELRDLESKLVLITGSKAENRMRVDQFLNTLHSVCRIAEVLIALQQAGNVKYSGWCLKFSCKVDMVDELQQQARTMEGELEDWKKTVRESRDNFYELNNYTTLQLLSLREDLGKLKESEHGRTNPVDPTVLALLQSITPEVTASDVRDVVIQVTKFLSECRGRAESGGEGFEHHSSSPTAQVFPTVEFSVNLTGAPEPALTVASPNQPSVLKDILKSIDKQASGAASHPTLTVKDLTEEQKAIYANMVDHNGFPAQLVLKALHECDDMYEVENWCTEHEAEMEDGEEEEEEEEVVREDTSSDGTGSDPEPDEPLAAVADDEIVRSKPSVTTSSGGATARITVSTRQAITEFHPTVLELTDAEYSKEQAIEAVERCGPDIQACMDYMYLMTDEGEGELFRSSLSVERDRVVQTQPMEEDFTTSQTSDGRLLIYEDVKAESRYLSLRELGIALEELSNALTSVVHEPRRFPKTLKPGSPNLLVTSPENVLRTTLSLFMEDEANSLPTLEEVLVCNEHTTAEEVTLLWRRAVGDPGYKRIFCLVHAEQLSYKECDKTLRSLTQLTQGISVPYRLAIICSSEEEEKSHIISKLHNDRRPYMTPSEPGKYQEYLKGHYKRGISDKAPSNQYGLGLNAACVDQENLCVRIVSSTRSGMGKSLFISRMADRLGMQRLVGDPSVTIPIHGPVVTPTTVMEFLKEHMTDSTSTIFHIDIAPTVLHEVDMILFSLLILRGLTDSQGRVWRCHPTQLYAVEVTLPEVEERKDLPERCTLALLELLPAVKCSSPRKAMELMRSGRQNPNVVLMDRQEFESAAYQRVYQYIRRNIAGLNLDRFFYTSGSVEGDCANCLEILLTSCGIKDPSWSEVCHFVSFLDVQLQSCEDSVFCDENLVGDVMSGLKGFVVKFMMRMSMDFATSSLQGEVARENDEAIEEGLEEYQIAERRKWEQSSHPYIFFNQDRMSITFVGFKVTNNGDLIDPRRGGVLEPRIMTQQLYTGLKQNKVNFEEDFLSWPKHVMIQKIATVMGIEYPYDPDESYVLTVDNLIKMLAIHMRFRCGIPVVIMGETGCGKTRLIRYMCDMARQGMEGKNMLIMKIHGGTTEKDVTKFVNLAEAEALENRKRNIDTVLFFDEANTTDAIGLIKEIMCDRRLHGKRISSDIKFIAACNPYRKHTDDMIEKLKSAGLGFYVRATQTQQMLGKIPLRELVYRVLDLPPSMRHLVYDFGQLNTGTEKDYTKQIVSDHVRKHPQLSLQGNGVIDRVARVLAWSQWYMRQREDECSFVSLRDVERAMIVFEYFFEKMAVLFGPLIDEKAAQEGVQSGEVDDVARSLLLAVCVCYHARLQDREAFEDGVSNQLAIAGGADRFRLEIKWCQDVLLDSMELGHNIARNAALRENIFMMAICIELRIPLFLVGKPGSSKSLAKSVVAASMQGQASNSKLLRNFKQVHMFSYQCSQLSTPESVIEVFSTAKRFQKGQDTTKYVSVVVLDEVGLAEDSPNLPLKALHPLLEDGTEGADDSQQIVDREKRVAFIGISNWALDPAKMNRGVMVTRDDPDVEELLLSARGICSDKENDLVKNRLEPHFRDLAEAYKAICKKQEREFFGLRDFYSLIKMLYWMCEKSGMPPTWPQLHHAIQRNFGGLEEKSLVPLEEFTSRIHNRTEPDLTNIPEELKPIVNPDCSKLGLIKTSLRTKETSWHGENRYLLFLTENYAALEILRHYLSDVVGCSSSIASASPTTMDLDEAKVLQPEDMEPFILFGSSFPKDREYTQVCRNINQIKICMETGRTVILLNLENLYESLYDVLNQYYIYHGGSRYVDLGLQTHRVKCRVHDHFKLILIAERTTVYEKFPTPLINRLEKHFVLTSSVLHEWQLGVLDEFKEWIHQFSHVGQSGGKAFKECDAFIGYQKDTPAAVVFQATNRLKSLRDGTTNSSRSAVDLGILGGIGPVELVQETEDSELWKQAVLCLSQFLLLHTTSPDALIRLQRTSLAEQTEDLQKLYSHEQCHRSLEEFLGHYVTEDAAEGGVLMQVTTHSHLLTGDEVDKLRYGKPWQISTFLLQEFDTELDFSNKVGPVFLRKPGDTDAHLLIIQCDSGHVDGDLIACARYRIYDERAKSKIQNSIHGKEGNTHVLFIIHLPRQATTSSFVGYQGDPWISTHIDDIRSPTEATLTLYQAMDASISDLFFSKVEHEVVQEERMQTEGEEMPPLEYGDDENMATEVSRNVEMEGEVEEENSMETDERAALEPSLYRPEPLGPTKQVLPQVPTPHELHATGYYQRLHYCIQAAASKLQDSERNKARSTDRVDILVGLVPKKPTLPLDYSSFHGVLIDHIRRLLEEREEVRVDEADWVLTEALNPKKLQNGGTFRNVLARKLDDVVIPIFAAIIALVDRNYNLNWIRREQENTTCAQFWLDMFRDPQIMGFRYEELVQGHVLGAGRRMLEDDFKCQLPFSWVIKEVFDVQWDAAKSNALGDSLQSLRNQLHDLARESPVCRVLDGVAEEDIETFYSSYVDDFVKMVHKCNHKKSQYTNLEYKLISDALRNLIAHHPDFSSVDGHTSLSSKVAAVHVVYQSTKSEILWFGQLAYQMPGILEPLQEKVPCDSQEMLLHLYAADRALASLEPPLKKDEGTMIQWLNNIRLSQNAVDSILSLPSETDICRRSRLQWQLVRALQLFVEHVIMKHAAVEGMILHARKLHMYLKNDPDFLKAVTVERLRKHLNAMDKHLIKQKVKELREIRQSCRTFFMELVSTLCFGGRTAPEPDLVKMLLDTIFTEKQETKDFSYKEMKTDEVPVIRSFLLQLLLEHNTEQVKVHLDDYFTRCRQLSEEVDQNLSLLCIQCFEDALYKTFTVKPLQEQVTWATTLLRQGHQALRSHTENRCSLLEYLEGIAQVRYALSVVAELLNKQTTGVPTSAFQDHQQLGALANQLLPAARDACSDAAVNHIDTLGSTDTTGPVVYLLKLLVRRYGTHCLQRITSTPTLSCSWLVPRELQRSDEEQHTSDPFVIYPHYAGVRDCMSTAAYGKDLKDLNEACQELEPKHALLLLMALYETATLSRGSSLHSKQLLPDVVEELDTFIQECKIFSKEMRWIARALLANQHGGPLAQLAIAPRQPPLQRTLGAIVVHTAVIFQSRQGVELLEPFVKMLNNPAALVNAYLPTMPEDDLPEAHRVLGGRFYECPRGHPYYVSECGRPVVEYTCPTCGDRIGGANHNLRGDNRTARQDDRTQTGHCLGPPDRRVGVPAPERTLSPAACCIIRALMHSALLWASCNNVGATQGLCDLVKPGVRAPHLPEFFWTHLEKDLEVLGKATGKSLDEAAVMMHLVLKQILEVDPPRQSVVGTISSLGARNARAEWEKIFNQAYLQPLLTKLEERVGTAMHTIVNDDKQEQDRLFFVVYERVKVVGAGMGPHLWTYRSRITLEHLNLILQRKNFKEKHPILYEFLQQEHNLRATQYLPGIVRLQQRLFDRFNHKLDRKEAKSLTIREFLRNINTENIRNEYVQLIESFQMAWSLVGSQLRHHGRLRVDDQYLIPAITDNTSIEFLIPTPTGAGACSMALADLLMLTHNSFIERCMGIVTQKEKSKSLWKKHEVPITHVHQCHLLDYEQQLLSIVLSHCRYALTIGQGEKITYDLPALEKHILDRFIHGKPLILSDIPQVAYRKDVYTAATFAAVRKKVHPQSPIPARLQQEILLELRTVDRLRETLDIVDIVLGFLSSGGANSGKPLGVYIKNTLKMRRPFCEKAKEYCTLGHILSLWETLSVELSRQITLSGQEPFDSVRSEYLEELDEEEEKALDKSLRLFDLDKLLGTLYEFIETYAKHSPLNEKDWPLVDTLEMFLERDGLTGVPNLRDGLPDTVTLGKTVATWKYIVGFQERQKHE